MLGGRRLGGSVVALVLLAGGCGDSRSAEVDDRVSVDVIVTGGTVLTMVGPNLEGGAVAIDDGRIVAVGPAAVVAAEYVATDVVDATGMAVLPGLVNAHTHAAMALFRGIADDRALMDWLQNFIFPAEAAFVDEEFVRWGTRLALVEMIASGTTTFADMYFFEAIVAEEVANAGMRAVLGQALIDFPTPDHATWEEAIGSTRAFVESFRDHPRIVPALAPHAPYTVSAEHLREVRSLATELGAPILIHVSETEDELRQVSDLSGGLTPVTYLNALGFLADDVAMAHGVWIAPDEMPLLAAAGVGISHNPESNMMLASGIAPVPALRAAGIDVGLGTDGPAGSNNDFDMFGEMASAARLQKVSTGDPEALGARDVLEMATIGGARTLGIDELVGTIEPGKRADLIVVDLTGPGTQPVYSVESALVYAASGSDVVLTMVEGRVLMREGEVLTVDARAVLAKAVEYRDRIAATLRGS